MALRTKNLTQMQVDTFTTLQEKLIEIRDEIVSTMSKAPINREIDYIQDRISKELYSDLIFERTDLIFLINRHISRILNPDQQEAIDTEVAKER